MAIAIPTGCHLQPDGGEGVDQNGNKTFTYPLKGPYVDLETLLHGLSQGDEVVSGWVFSSADLAKRLGALGVLTLRCLPKDTVTAGEGGQQTTTQVALEETWTLRSVRNDMSILGYCGARQSASDPSREQIEAWMKEPDGTLAEANKYRRADGTVEEITQENTLDVIDKIRAGVESVMRFHPQLTKTRTYTTPPLVVYEHLAEIDTPALGATGTALKQKFPGNLPAIIASCEWLKCQDDADQTADGKWRRVESWMGLPKTAGNGHPWDADLYGASGRRWEIPHSGAEGGEE